MKRPPVLPLVEFAHLFPEFRRPSWDGWKAILRRLTPEVREFYAMVGRGAGKSRIVALLACAFATRPYPVVPGERIYIGVFAPSRTQAGVTFRYIVGLLRSIPALEALIERDTNESLTLSTGVVIEVLSATIAAPRGRAYALVIVEEAAFLPTEAAANPDVELLNAVRPALARVEGSLLAVVSSPYARRGVLYRAYQRYRGQGDGPVVFVQAPTLQLNPTFDASAIARAYDEDPASAAAEYGAEFRGDVEQFLTLEVLEAAIVAGRRELAPCLDLDYFAFLDFSGGAGTDASTVAIAHAEMREGRAVGVLDAVREVRPPFSPAAVCQEFAALIRSYGLFTARADRYAGAFVTEQMQLHDVSVYPSAWTKSQIYAELAPRFYSRVLELPDVPRLTLQLGALERRVGSAGRDAVDHPPGGHDDVANAACGALAEAFKHAPVFGTERGQAVTSERQRRQLTALERLRANGETYTSAQEALNRACDAMRPFKVVRTLGPPEFDEHHADTDYDPDAVAQQMREENDL